MRHRERRTEAAAPTAASAEWIAASAKHLNPAPSSHTPLPHERMGGLVVIEDHEPDPSRAAAALVSVLLWQPKGRDALRQKSQHQRWERTTVN